MIGKIPATITKISSVVFLSATFVFALKYFDVDAKNGKLKKELTLDKQTYKNDLKAIFDRYDNVVAKNQILSKQLQDEKELSNQTKPIIVEKIVTIKQKMNTKKWDSLHAVLQSKNSENTELANQVKSLIEQNKGLQRENNLKAQALEASKNLTATNVYANGIKIVSNNIIETKRFTSTEQIKVCFTLLENKAAIKGNKDIYIQILNPNNKIVSKNGQIETDSRGLFSYSAKTNIYYDNEELDVCVFVDPNKTDLIKGDYEINIFSGINLIGNTVFTLK